MRANTDPCSPFAPVATFSIAAYDEQTRDLGVAVASKFLAVGVVVPWARAGVGAVATQAHANVAYGPDALTLMANGASAQDTLDELIGADSGAAVRQCGVVDASGNAAAHTGPDCMEWAGHVIGDGFTCQGNILAGPAVVAAMAGAFVAAGGAFADRLIAALRAGEAAGGDRRGRQSAALLIVRAQGGYGGGNDRWIDLRVEDHHDPLAELGRLLALHRVYFPHGEGTPPLPLNSVTIESLARHLVTLGYLEPGRDVDAPVVLAAFRRFAGVENLEERLRDDSFIDAQALAFLQRLAHQRTARDE